MRVELCLKFQSDLHCNHAMRKSDEHTKHVSWFANTKVYSLLPILVVTDERENRELNELTALDRQRQINHCRMIDTNMDLGFIL